MGKVDLSGRDFLDLKIRFQVVALRLGGLKMGVHCTNFEQKIDIKDSAVDAAPVALINYISHFGIA